MIIFIGNIILTAVPSLILLIYFYKKDKSKREPKVFILVSFLLGFLSVIPAVFMEILIEQFWSKLPFTIVQILNILFSFPTAILNRLGDSHFSSHTVSLFFFDSFIIAGLVEEGMKLITVLAYPYRLKAFDRISDGIVFTITVSLGFAFFENVIYSLRSDNTAALLLLRAFTAVPLHAFASGIMGYYIGLSHFRPKKYFLRGLCIAIGIHGLYNFIILSNSRLAFLVFPLLMASGYWTLRLIRKAQQTDCVQQE